MKQLIQLSATLVLLLTPGCMMLTEGVRWDNQRYRSNESEFIRNLHETPRPLHTGTYVEAHSTNEGEHALYQFRGLLRGPTDRTLVIAVPIDPTSTNPVSVYETYEPSAPHGTSCLLLECACGSGDPLFMEHRCQHMETNSCAEYSVVLHLEHDAAWRRIIPGITTAWKIAPTTTRLNWTARSRSVLLRKRLRYLYTVPLDIVLSPFELLFGMYMLGEAG